MAWTLGLCGFGARAAARDRLIVTAATPAYDTVNLPDASGSSTAMGATGLHYRRPWYDDAAGTPNEPSTGAVGFHARLLTSTNGADNDSRVVGIARDGDEYVAVSTEPLTNRVTLRIAGVVRATAERAAVRMGVFERLLVVTTGADAGDTVHVWLDGDLSTPVVTYTLSSDDATALGAIGSPNEFLGHCSDAGTDLHDDLVAFDPADPGFPGLSFLAACSIAEQLVTGDGPDPAWDGDWTDIAERPADDETAIRADAIAAESTFSKAPIGHDNVLAVQVLARVTRVGAAAGEHLTVGLVAGDEVDAQLVPAPEDGDVLGLFQTAPAGTAWTPDAFDASRVLFRSET